MKLILPAPKSPNREPKNPFARQRLKDEYREAVWAAAIKQLAERGEKPPRDPPQKVTVKATFYYARLPRDEDNLDASLKDVLDSLRQKQAGAMRWRNGLYTKCGYFVDDDPAHLTVEKPEQIKVATVKEQRLELELVGG